MDSEPKQYVIERVRDALAHDARVAERDVHVRVLGPRLYLQGSVTTAERRDAATQVAREVAPDHQVVNDLSVVGYTEPSEEERLT